MLFENFGISFACPSPPAPTETCSAFLTICAFSNSVDLMIVAAGIVAVMSKDPTIHGCFLIIFFTEIAIADSVALPLSA